MPRYAKDTEVSSAKSRTEIEQTLTRYGATGFLYGWLEASAMVAFQMKNRHVKFVLPMPPRDDFRYTPNQQRERSEDQISREFDKAVRQRWRALLLVIKAKLEAVECGITVFDEEFMSHIVLPDGQTVGQWMRPQIERAYERGKMPSLLSLPAPERGNDGE